MGSTVRELEARLDDIISYLKPNYRALWGISLGLTHLRKHRCVQRFSSILPFWCLFWFIKHGPGVQFAAQSTVIWTERSLPKLSFRATSEVPIMSGFFTLYGHL